MLGLSLRAVESWMRHIWPTGPESEGLYQACARSQVCTTAFGSTGRSAPQLCTPHVNGEFWVKPVPGANFGQLQYKLHRYFRLKLEGD